MMFAGIWPVHPISSHSGVTGLMGPHNWERFSFGTWLLNAAPRLHRNKLATALANKLARITWSILRSNKTSDAPRHEVMAI
jgi:transposase